MNSTVLPHKGDEPLVSLFEVNMSEELNQNGVKDAGKEIWTIRDNNDYVVGSKNGLSQKKEFFYGKVEGGNDDNVVVGERVKFHVEKKGIDMQCPLVPSSQKCKHFKRVEDKTREVHDETVDKRDYLYMSEHLQIRKDNEIFVSTSLNNYINDHVNIILSANDTFFKNKNNEAEAFIDLGIKLKMLRYRDRMKRQKKRKKKGGIKKSTVLAKSNVETNRREIQSSQRLTGGCADVMELPLEEDISSSSSSLSDVSISSCADVVSTPCRSAHCNSSSESSCLFSDSSDSEQSSSENGYTSEEEFLKNMQFDEEELRTLKSLERAKNVYFGHVNELFMKYDMMSHFNLKFFEKLKNTIHNMYIRNIPKDKYKDHLQSIRAFFSNEENARMVERNQKKLRSDVTNAMFGFHVISDRQPMKVPIKCINRLTCRNKPASAICAYKSAQNKKRAETIFDELCDGLSKRGATTGDSFNTNSRSNTTFRGEDKWRTRRRDACSKIAGEKDKNRAKINGDTKKIDSVTRNCLEEYVKSIRNNSCAHSKMRNLKQYILGTHWKQMRKHNVYLSLIMEDKRKDAKMIANLCYNQMKGIEQKRKLILEKEEKERMRLLRENDMDAYIKLIKTTKNKRLQELLDVTEDFLNSMSSSVLYQKGGSNGGTTSFKNARERYYSVSHTIKEKIVQPSILIGGTLMKYQLEGLEWLVSLYNNNLHGILADEMGLGKTVQTISLFAYLKEFKGRCKKISASTAAVSGRCDGCGECGKHIIVVPLSTLPNWVSEFDRWCPSLRVLTYRGSKSERRGLSRQLLDNEFDICLTTFDFVIKEKALLMKISWDYIVVDEGHRMKNSKSRFHTILSGFKSKHRVLLTGTPLQNNMSELWSLLNFLLPKIFASCTDFEKWFVRSLYNEKDVYDTITEEEQLLIINRLHSVLLPFMLRRVKKDVLKSLPRKYEYNIYIELSLYQKILYRQIQNKGFKQVNENGSITTKSFQNLVMQLRKIVNHPYLFQYEYAIDEMMIKTSGKFEVLDRMLPKLLTFKHKVLIFSQMTKLMDILCDYLDFRGYRFHRLDGNIGLHERKKIIEKFNRPSPSNNSSGVGTGEGTGAVGSTDTGVDTGEDAEEEAMIFILSTRSGSLGLNLQSADTVIIFDSDFNPHQDIQAMCRCHRIGQKNVVKVFRFITISGVEELVFKRAQHKLSINDKVIQAGLFNKIYNDEDRKNKLKNIMHRNQRSDITSQPTNPLLLDHYLSRSEEELEFFLNFDREYFGEEHYELLNLLNQANPDCAQFTYMSEGEDDAQKEVEEEAVKGMEEVARTARDQSDVEKNEENKVGQIGYNAEIGDQRYNVTDGIEVKGENQQNHVVTSNCHSKEDTPGGISDELKGEEAEREGVQEVEGDNVETILNEENQNEIEKILIKSNKLVNKEQLPSHLFFEEETIEVCDVYFKRRRKIINTKLLEEEKLTDEQFFKMVDPTSPCRNVTAEQGPSKRGRDHTTEHHVDAPNDNNVLRNSRDIEMEGSTPSEEISRREDCSPEDRTLRGEECLHAIQSASKIECSYNIRSLRKAEGGAMGTPLSSAKTGKRKYDKCTDEVGAEKQIPEEGMGEGNKKKKKKKVRKSWEKRSGMTDRDDSR
ncbi:DEAD/DEAH box helicase, putative [Plasmodium ovale curtisi]|uniref:DEAD/DEAH box helicase, putative n=1 Tax=Plasmodium ovale curtisi TaxID=864141 RepID=A0A1A8VJX9_PLAOA|nr:DEAD/DEAH box helicase, putative [Plasmodium ovale curtisi]SBS81343.1 DEAD/DEAH box helicase, putative [Plasmodium ovale curtisi]